MWKFFRSFKTNYLWWLTNLGLHIINSEYEREPNCHREFSREANTSSTRNPLIQLVSSEKEPRPQKFYGEGRFIQQVLPLVAAIDVVDSEEEPLIAFNSNNRCQATKTFETPSAFLTPLADIQARPTLVVETTQGSHSTTSSLNPKLLVLCSPAE